MKRNIKLGLVVALLSVMSSASMYASGGYKADNAHVPLIIGLFWFLVFSVVPLFFAGLAKIYRESKLVFYTVIVYVSEFILSQVYFDLSVLNGLILSVFAVGPVMLIGLLFVRALSEKYPPIVPNGPLNLEMVHQYDRVQKQWEEYKKNKLKKRVGDYYSDVEYAFLPGNIHNIDMFDD